MNTRLTITLALAGLLAGGAGAAWAAGDADREASALDAAKISLMQAITIAEQQTGGRAYDAGVDVDDAGKTRFKVETSGPGGATTVTVDAQDGRILASHSGGELD